jgi:hypothetical protein
MRETARAKRQSETPAPIPPWMMTGSLTLKAFGFGLREKGLYGEPIHWGKGYFHAPFMSQHTIFEAILLLLSSRSRKYLRQNK